MHGDSQLSLAAIDTAVPPGIDHGEVFTRRWVAELILDLAGYTAEQDLGAKVIVEPSCGLGAFLVPIVERLLASVGPEGLADCGDQIRAFDLLAANADRARKTVVELLASAGTPLPTAEHLATSWVRAGDFLLSDLDIPDRGADFIVGNPPYVRLENVPAETMAAYRGELTTMTGRSDLYVGFYERGLRLLAQGGTLAFICADRWMHNQYGAALRELVSESYSLDTVITMHDVDAFEDAVSSYPAISVLRARPQGRVVVANANARFHATTASQLHGWVRGHEDVTDTAGFAAARLDRWHQGPGLWPSGNPAALALVTGLESRFPPLQDAATATRVGIGVATGADGVYLTNDADLVEDDRLLPVVTAGDIASGSPVWSGRHLVNPWTDEGLVDLAAYPRLAAYFEQHATRLRARHVAKRRPAVWYRTIDRVTPGLQQRPKLLLPDIKARSHPVLDGGAYYPHHNLYYVVSEGWDLPLALGGLLLSDVANLFVGTYCVKMRGGCYRFQAQYLRQIRVPPATSVQASTVRSLAAAFRDRDRARATGIACRLYGIDEHDLARAGR